ncbi:FAD binding domain-containing protein [Alkaliphilus transvaalensis]|uniref:FAD binding domain-containing protein n=1 Tax=Alkaliphilus transvaalensis TaxID=114628 RepID=UPI0005590962|nr:FAD binding domain-containing protein [Alkaliphilus transvaalensis]
MEINKTFQETEVEAVLSLLDQYQDNSKIIAGGTDIIIQLHQGRVNPEVLIDISNLNEIKEIKQIEGRILIGSATTFTSLMKSQVIPKNLWGLIEAASQVGSPQIRNAATIGGNICNGSPAADIVPPLLALNSQLVIANKMTERKVPLETFFIDKGKVDLKNNELLSYIEFENIKENQGLGFTKLGLRKALAISRISVAVFLEMKDGCFNEIRIATGSCGKFAIREKEVEDFMRNKQVTDELIEAGANLYSNIILKRLAGRHGSDYKSEAIKGIFKDGLGKATHLAKKGGV